MLKLRNLAVLCLFLFMYTGCSSSPPNIEMIKQDCEQIASNTIYVDFTSGEHPMLECTDVKIIGTSMSGETAQIVTDMSVRYRIDVGRNGGIKVGKNGFSAWVKSSDWSPIDGFEKTKPRKGDTRQYRVTMKYRKYDTGWRLEDYE